MIQRHRDAQPVSLYRNIIRHITDHICLLLMYLTSYALDLIVNADNLELNSYGYTSESKLDLLSCGSRCGSLSGNRCWQYWNGIMWHLLDCLSFPDMMIKSSLHRKIIYMNLREITDVNCMLAGSSNCMTSCLRWTWALASGPALSKIFLKEKVPLWSLSETITKLSSEGTALELM